MSEIDAGTLSLHFRELQQEKKKLENKLEHLKMKRKDLESKQDTIAKKNFLLLQKNDNMTRTVSVAKKKVQETQLQVDKLQKMNDVLQKQVSDVKGLMDEEETKKENMIAGYLQKYDELAESFRGARNYYVDSVLTDEELQWKQSNDERRKQVETSREAVAQVADQMEQLKVMSDVVLEEKPAKSIWRQYLDVKDDVKYVVETHLQEAQQRANQLTEQVNKARNKLEALDREVREIEARDIEERK